MFGDVDVFFGVLAVVVEFEAFEFLAGDGPVYEAVAVGDEGMAHAVALLRDVAGGLAEGGALPFLFGLLQEGDEAGAFQCGGGRDAAELAEGGIDVDELDEAIGAAANGMAGGADDEWGVGGMLVVGLFAPEAVVAEVPAVGRPRGR